MKTVLQAVETIGRLEGPDLIRLDSPLPDTTPVALRVIVLFPMKADDIDEQEWLQALAKNSAFDFLNDPAEDIYSVQDGKPFHAG